MGPVGVIISNGVTCVAHVNYHCISDKILITAKCCSPLSLKNWLYVLVIN